MHRGGLKTSRLIELFLIGSFQTYNKPWKRESEKRFGNDFE